MGLPTLASSEILDPQALSSFDIRPDDNYDIAGLLEHGKVKFRTAESKGPLTETSCDQEGDCVDDAVDDAEASTLDDKEEPPKPLRKRKPQQLRERAQSGKRSCPSYLATGEKLYIRLLVVLLFVSWLMAGADGAQLQHTVIDTTKKLRCDETVAIELELLRVNHGQWTGPPYSVALLDHEEGTICCNSEMPPHWRSLSPTVEGLANGKDHARPGYKVCEWSPGYYCLQFSANISSTPTKMSCSESVSGIERIVHVLVFTEALVCNKTMIAGDIKIMCSAEFRGDGQWRPSFQCTPFSDPVTEPTSYENKTGLQRTTSTFSIPENLAYTSIECSLKFNQEGNDVGTATNTPELRWRWTSPDEDPPKLWATSIIPAGLLMVLIIALVVFFICQF